MLGQVAGPLPRFYYVDRRRFLSFCAELCCQECPSFRRRTSLELLKNLPRSAYPDRGGLLTLREGLTPRAEGVPVLFAVQTSYCVTRLEYSHARVIPQ